MKFNLRIITIIVLALSCLVFLAIYFFQFRNYGLSNNSDDWGNFGSYFAGGLGTILGFANLLLIYYTYNDQRRLNNRQQFESTFFNLLSNHRETINNAIDNRENWDNLNSVHDNTEFFSYSLLKEFYEDEVVKMEYALNVFRTFDKSIEAGHKFILSYRPLFNFNIFSKDYLVVIVNSISDLYHYINTSDSIDDKVKEFYRNILRDSITESEKFFLVLFHIQKRNFLRKRFERSEILFFINQNSDLKAYLLMNEDFPFASCGIVSKSKGSYFTLSKLGLEMKDLFRDEIEYKIKPLLNPIFIQNVHFSSDVEHYNYKIEVNETIDRMQPFTLINFNKIFEDVMKQSSIKTFRNHDPFDVLKTLPEQSGSSSTQINLNLVIEAFVGETKFLIKDYVKFEFVLRTSIEVECSKPHAFREDYILHSFGEEFN